MSPTKGSLRGIRAALLGVAGLSLALMAHVAAGGAAPGPVALLSLAGLIGLAAVLLTGLRLGPVLIGASLAAMQVGLHQAFMWLGAPADCVMSGMTGMNASAAGHLGRTAQPAFECATGMTHAGMSQTSAVAATTMVGAHAVATAVMAALLAYGEKVLWFLAGYVHPARWLRVLLPEPSTLRISSSDAPRMLHARFPCGGVGQRGPPARDLFAIAR